MGKFLNAVESAIEVGLFSACSFCIIAIVLIRYAPANVVIAPSTPQAVVYLDRDFARCNIKDYQHVQNYCFPHVGACMYCAVETVGNYLGIDKLRDFHVDKGPASPMTMTEELTNLGVEYTLLLPMDVNVLKRYTDSGHPVVVGFHPFSSLGSHACTVYHVDNRDVYFIDPNHPTEHFRFSREDFQKYNCWWGLVILK